MEKIISLTDKQVEEIDIIDNFFTQKQNELRLAMLQTEKIYANAPDFFVPKATGKIFVGERSEPLIVFADLNSERFSENHSVTAKVMSDLLDSESEEKIEFCATTNAFLHGWNWDAENPVPVLDKDSVRLEISLVFVSFPPSAYRDFAFNDIPRLSDRAIQKLLTKINTVDLIDALKSASVEVQNKFFFNMSKRAAQMLKEDMEFRGEVSLLDSYAAQRKIIEAVHELEKSGEVEIPKLTYADKF